MSDENPNELPGWRKKFLASRMAVESILFEREVTQVKKQTLARGLLVLGGIWLLHALLLAQWALRRGYFFNQADAASFDGVLRYAAYLKAQGFWALLKPELADLTLNPPLYYLSYVPVFDYITSDLNAALIIVNSFFLFVLALSIFLAVRDSRPNSAGWFGAAFALAFPFVLETARRPSPEMALMALAAALYACFIRSDDFNHPKWTLAFALCLGLGFFAHRHFWLYALPLAPFVLAGLSNPNSRDELIKGLLPGMIINLPWYLFAAAALTAGLVPFWGEYHGLWHYFKLGVSAAGLPLFVVGGAALAWLHYSVFMPYEKKKVVSAWFWAPYLFLAFGVRGSRAELLYPAMLSFSIAAAIMTPHAARKYLLGAVLALGALNQSGLVRPFPSGNYPIAGLPKPAAADYRAAELLAAVEANTPADGGLVGLYGDANLNAASLRYAASRKGLPVKFADVPACPGCAFALVHKTPRFGEADSAAEKDFLALRELSWFQATFDKKAEFELADTSKAQLYARVPSTMKFLEEGPHTVRNVRLGPLQIEEGTLELSGFDAATGAYARAEFFAPAANLMGGDVYGLTLDLENLCAAGPFLDPFVPAGVGAVKLRSAKITEYAVERFLADRLPFIEELEVGLDDNLQISGLARGRKFSAVLALSVKNGGVLEAKPLSFSLGKLTLPPYVLALFTFRQDFTDNPYGIKVNGLRLGRSMLELY